MFAYMYVFVIIAIPFKIFALNDKNLAFDYVGTLGLAVSFVRLCNACAINYRYML